MRTHHIRSRFITRGTVGLLIWCLLLDSGMSFAGPRPPILSISSAPSIFTEQAISGEGVLGFLGYSSLVNKLAARWRLLTNRERKKTAPVELGNGTDTLIEEKLAEERVLSFLKGPLEERLGLSSSDYRIRVKLKTSEKGHLTVSVWVFDKEDWKAALEFEPFAGLNTIRITGIRVRPGYLRHGVATALLRFAFQENPSAHTLIWDRPRDDAAWMLQTIENKGFIRQVRWPFLEDKAIAEIVRFTPDPKISGSDRVAPVPEIQEIYNEASVREPNGSFRTKSLVWQVPYASPPRRVRILSRHHDDYIVQDAGAAEGSGSAFGPVILERLFGTQEEAQAYRDSERSVEQSEKQHWSERKRLSAMFTQFAIGINRAYDVYDALGRDSSYEDLRQSMHALREGSDMLLAVLHEAERFKPIGGLAFARRYALRLAIQAGLAEMSNDLKEVTRRMAANSQKILVVEDEPGVLNSIVKVLQEDGEYAEIMEAVSPSDAMTRYFEGGIGLVVLDDWMPHPGDGAALIAWFRSQNPDLPILFMSGAFDNKTAAQLKKTYPDRLDFIEKPLSIDPFLRKVKALLPSKSGQPVKPEPPFIDPAIAPPSIWGLAPGKVLGWSPLTEEVARSFVWGSFGLFWTGIFSVILILAHFLRYGLHAFGVHRLEHYQNGRFAIELRGIIFAAVSTTAFSVIVGLLTLGIIRLFAIGHDTQSLWWMTAIVNWGIHFSAGVAWTIFFKKRVSLGQSAVMPPSVWGMDSNSSAGDIKKSIREVLPTAAEERTVDYISSRFSEHWQEALSMMGNELLHPQRWRFIDQELASGIPISTIADLAHFRTGKWRLEDFPEPLQVLVLKYSHFNGQSNGIDRLVLPDLAALWSIFHPVETQSSPALQELVRSQSANRLFNELLGLARTKTRESNSTLSDQDIVTLVLTHKSTSKNEPYLDMPQVLQKTEILSELHSAQLPGLFIQVGPLRDKPGLDGINVSLKDPEQLNQFIAAKLIPEHSRNRLLLGTLAFRLEDKGKTLVLTMIQSWPRRLSDWLSAGQIEKILEEILIQFVVREGVERIVTRSGAQLFEIGIARFHRHTIQRLNKLHHDSGFHLIYRGDNLWWELRIDETHLMERAA